MSEQKRQDSTAGEGIAPETRYGPSPHKPNTSQEDEHVYVLTLTLTPSISVPLSQMREDYFPKHLNRTPAHLTLFHALPHSQIDAIDADLKSVSSCTRPFNISTGMPFRMRRGVAVGFESGDKESQVLREELRGRWLGWLSAQDSSGWRAHWTVMNKVDEQKKVEQAFNSVRRILFEDVHEGKAIGLDLWRHDHGDWKWVKEYRFSGSAKAPVKKQDSNRKEGYPDPNPNPHQSKGSEPAEDPAESTGALKRGGNKVAVMWKSMNLRRKGLGNNHER